MRDRHEAQNHRNSHVLDAWKIENGRPATKVISSQLLPNSIEDDEI